MKAKEVLKILGISRLSLCNYVKDGRIKVKAKISNNFYDYDEDSVYKLIGIKTERHKRLIVSYSRVSIQNIKKDTSIQNSTLTLLMSNGSKH